MKYIRTKDGIYRVLQYGSVKKHYVVIAVCLGHKVIDTSEIIKTADTIEELCDEFVVVENKSHNIPSYLEEAINRFMEKQDGELSDDYHIEIYGAIWTDKGLIYKAKMNSNGELELL